jgi:hypothetical protein
LLVDERDLPEPCVVGVVESWNRCVVYGVGGSCPDKGAEAVTKAVRWSPEELAAYQKRQQLAATPAPTKKAPAKKAKNPKYRSRKVVVDGETYDSEKEYRRWLVLVQMQRTGLIVNLKRQVSFELAPAIKLEGEDRKKPALRYWADAVYVQGGLRVVEDTKSEPTRAKESYRIKKHLMATVHGIHIKEA